MYLKIWQKHFLLEFCKILFLFIFCFYGLYMLIDYSSKSSMYQAVKFTWGEIATYYFYVFVQRMDIIIPFAILIASIKTLTRLNIHYELVALMASGIKLKQLMRPFIFLTLLITAFLFLNNEFFLPKVMHGLQKLEDSHFTQKYQQEKKTNVKKIDLEGKSVLLYHNYDTHLKEFLDVFWIHSFDEIFRLKTLSMETENPRGTFVEVFKRSPEGNLQLVSSHEVMELPSLKIEKKMIKESLIDPKDLPITELAAKIHWKFKTLPERDAKMMTAFARKTALPWLCFIAFLAPAPFCLVFTRQLPVFFIYLCSMFGIVAFYLLINAATIIGESQVVSPLIAIWAPCLMFFTYFIWRYSKAMKK